MTSGNIASRHRYPPVTLETIAEAMDILAAIIARDGPAVLPLYERLELEYQLLETRTDTMSRVMARAGRHTGGNVISLNRVAS
ncbi:MAG: hypothetical protein Q4G49_07605 [Paracoccus sp. (in: a-proteobacteria)]|nr:hypothetical protein [Paracoccus sp. (in: a-proteobacteria)]